MTLEELYVFFGLLLLSDYQALVNTIAEGCIGPAKMENSIGLKRVDNILL